MDKYLFGIGGILLSVVSYFLVNLHNRFEDHLKASAEADKDFAAMNARQEEQCDRLNRVENKVDKLGDDINLIPYKVVELLKVVK